MFLLYCASDNSHCLVENENVIYDEDNIKKDNKCYMEKRLDMFRLEKTKKEKKITKNEALNKTEISLRKRNETEPIPSKVIKSSVKDITKKKNDTKKVLKKIQRTSNAAVFNLLNEYPNVKLSDNNASNSNNNTSNNNNNDSTSTINLMSSNTMIDDYSTLQDNKRMNRSPTKEELKKMLFETRKKLEERSLVEKKIGKDSCQLNPSEDNSDPEMNIENSDTHSDIINPIQNVDNDIENFEDDNNIEIEEFENTDTQLYGKDFEPKMVHLKNNFYCRNAMYYAALGNSHRPSHIVRRLLSGVFQKEALINNTLTGQSPRAQGKDRQNVKMSFLHPFAINAIVDFSIEYGIKHGWAKQTKKELHRAITQRMGEIKRESKNE